MTGKERAYFRKIANSCHPTLYIGKEGITEQVIAEARDAAEANELIKGSVQQGAPVDAREALATICDRIGAEPISQIGRKFVLYKKNNKHPKLIAP